MCVKEVRGEIAEAHESASVGASPGTEAAAVGTGVGGAYGLHDELRPHQAVGAALQELLDGVLVPGHRSRLTGGKTQRRQAVNFFQF